jgi:WD40 repeat protein
MIAEILDDDIRLSTSETGISLSNPFPGLRSFEISESHLFFGQDQICDQILKKLKDNRFVCILGGAGVGKTSLINCGIKPALFSSILPGFNSSWQIFHLQPGKNPILNLARCISKSKKVEFFDEDQHLREQVCYNILKRGRQGLIEIVSQISNSKDSDYLFVIDQFEDLFRLRTKNDNYSFYEEAAQYVDLLLEALKMKDSRVHLVVSIRSDFTDDCILFPALAELINKSNIVVPKMNRDQLRDVILGPLRVFKVQAEESLISRILNDAAISEDVLPRIQHTLHQTWKSWIGQSNWHKPITLKEYEATGGITNSISAYANTIYESLNDSNKRLCESIFKSLTERGSENKGLTRSVTLGELSLICKAEISDVKDVINTFRNQDVKLLQFEEAEHKPEGNVNLIHVSLIRLWDRLNAWVEDEAISGQMYKQLSETSAAYLVGKAGLLRPPDLNFALNWKEKQLPNLNWAKRYNPAFERTMVYLSTSHETYQAEEELKKLKDHKAKKKVRSFFVVLGGTLVIAVALIVFSQISKSSAEMQRQIALEQKQEAIAKSEKAEILSKEAVEEKTRAQYAANEAEKMRQQVEDESKVLVVQKQYAELTAQQAVKKTAETEQNFMQLSQQKNEIEKNALQANLQKTEAEKGAEAAFRKQMITAAQALAVKSAQISGNKNLKALLSLHAFRFNDNYGGPEIHPDIFNALLSSATELGISTQIPFKAHVGAVNALCVSSRQNILYSTGSDGKVYAWNLADNSPAPRIIANFINRNLSMAISQNGRLLAVGSDMGIIRVIDLSNPDNITELKGSVGAVFSLAFSRDAQQLFSTSSDKRILLWDLSSRKSSEIYNDANTVRAITISPDGRFLVAGADDGKLLLWDIKADQMSVLSAENSTAIYSLAFNSSGTMVASGDLKGNIKLWNPYSRKIIKNLKSHFARVVDIKFSQTGDLLVTSSYDGTAYIFDTKYLNNPPQIIKEPSTYIMSAAFSSNNQRVIVATNKNENIIAWPASCNVIAKSICSKVSRSLSAEEWNTYIGSDIKFEKPCE